MVKEIKIGGESRPVKFTINALIDFEELTGIDLTSGVEVNLTNAKNIRALIFVGLKHGAKSENVKFEYTVEDVGSWIAFGDESIPEFLKALNKNSASDNLEQSGEPEESKK